MVSGIRSYDLAQQLGATQGWGTQTLTNTQQSLPSSILSQYNSANLSGSDAESLMRALRQAGIPMGSELSDAMHAQGFDLKQVSSQARQQREQQQQPSTASASGSSGSTENSGTGGINVSALQSLQSILGQYDLSNLSSDQQNQLTSQLQQSGLLQSGNIIDLGA